MTFRDLTATALEGMWRMKLRSFLTTAGVVIAIAAFVTMLSFGAGNRKFVVDQFNAFGLFSTVQVFPSREQADDSTTRRALDYEAVEEIASLPGVALAFPLDKYDITLSLADTSYSGEAMYIPPGALEEKMFQHLAAGRPYRSDSVAEAIVAWEVLESSGFLSPDSLLGKSVVVAAELSSVDSGLIAVVRDEQGRIRQRINSVTIDSLAYRSYRQRVFNRELKSAINRFLDGYMNARRMVSDTLTIVGVMKNLENNPLRISDVIVPLATAQKFSAGGLWSSPKDLLTAMQSGIIIEETGISSSRQFPRMTVFLEPGTSYRSVMDSIEALGFRAHSFAADFADMQRFFRYFDMALGMIGAVALLTAALGIINTLVMSIIERRKEIGILKALGADDRDIRIQFLFESGLIGVIGSVCGIVFGWIVSRIASAVAQRIMAAENIPAVDLFYLPPWVIVTAFIFGFAVSILAGLYPAARAARVDPVETLRSG
jgi:ABC-type lipoprotein release transport system permease subunit